VLDLRPVSYRVLLLASVAGMAFSAGSADATNFTNTTPTTNSGPSFSLQNGDSLNNSSSVTSTGAGQPAVTAGSGAAAIINSGLIQGTGANGIGIQVVSGGSVGSISNSGTVQATDNGAAIEIGEGGGGPANAGTLTNTGLIQSLGSGSAIQVDAGGSIAAIMNSSASAIIQAMGSGNAINVLGTVGTIGNAGSILAASAAAINIAAGGSVGSLSNAGAILSSGGPGVLNAGSLGGIANSGTISSILNSGQIVSAQGTAIANLGAGAIINGITNAVGGLIEGGPANGSGVAIDNSGATAGALTINDAGTIVGAIKLGPRGDTLNVTGGAITGAIIGLAGSNDIVNFSPTGTFTTGGAISNVDTINVANGTLVLQNAATSTFAGSAFNIAAGAVTDMNAPIQATNVNNSGLLNVGGGSQTITGNYNQAASGSLGVTVNGAGAANAGKLTVSGTATILGGANAVSVHVPVSVDPFALTNASWHVLTSGALVANEAALTAISDNAGISFGLTDTATDLILMALQQTPTQIVAAAQNDVATIFAPFPGTPNSGELAARQFLIQVFVGIASSGNLALAHSLDSALSNLTPGQVLQLNNQLMPSTLTTGAINLGTSTSLLGAGDAAIFGRQVTTRIDTEQTGLAAGDEVGRGFSFWGQPFGAISSQGAQGGYDGYSAGTYGVTLGADTMVMPDVRAGVALTLSNTNLSYTGSLSGNTGEVFTGELGAYATWYLPDNFFLDGLLAFGYNHYNQHNLISALGVALDSDYGGWQFNAKIGAGYDYKLPAGMVLTPYISVQQYHFNYDGYTTTGGSAYDLDMHVGSNSADVTQTRLGARVGQPVALSNGGVLTPEVHAYWLHDFGSNQISTTYTTADFVSPNTFTMVGPAFNRDMANIGISATFKRAAGWSFSGGYDFLGSSSFSTHNFYVQLKIDF